jgi:hypothetical protein
VPVTRDRKTRQVSQSRVEIPSCHRAMIFGLRLGSDDKSKITTED